jgi:hypothetical protein
MYETNARRGPDDRGWNRSCQGELDEKDPYAHLRGTQVQRILLGTTSLPLVPTAQQQRQSEMSAANKSSRHSMRERRSSGRQPSCEEASEAGSCL